MLFKIILWAIIGYFVYSWFQEKFQLKQGDKNTTIHHHHYHEGKKEGKGKSKDDDYIDYEELNN